MNGIVKKTVCIIVALSMMSFVFTGCKTTPSTSGSTSTSSSSSNFNETGLPIVKNQVTVTILTTRWASMGDSFTKNQWLIDLQKNTNVVPKWTVYSLDSWTDKKATLLAGGSLPEVIFGNQSFSDTDILNNLDYFIDMTDLISKYMPNLTAAMAETPSMKTVCTFPDGKIYSLPKNMPCRPTVCNQPFINKTWLTKLGLKEPTNIDELETVFKAFRTKDPNGNGKKDEYPISGSQGIATDLFNPFGITDLNGKHMCINSDGTMYYYPIASNYRTALEWLNKLYKEDLIDKEAFTQDGSALDGKRKNETAPQVGFEYAWTPDSNFGKWASQYTTLAPIKGPDGKAYAAGDKDGISSIGRNEVEITTTCKQTNVVARWLDQWYTGEASIQNFWGAIGTVITKNSDDTYTLNNPPTGTSADSWYWDQSLRDFGPKYASLDFQKKVKLNSTSGDGLKVEISKLGADYIQTPYPNVMFTVDESNKVASYNTDIEKAITTWRAKFITEGVTDATWNAYLAEMKKDNVDALVQIYKDAYARYTK